MKEVTLLFLVQENKVLLAMKKRGFGANRYNGVGGKLDSGETVEQALVRECQEEISVTPIAYEQFADIMFHEFHDGQAATMHVHVFVATTWQGEPTESEEMAPKWFKKDELPLDQMWSDDPYWLPQVLDGEKLTASFTLDENDAITDMQITSGLK